MVKKLICTLLMILALNARADTWRILIYMEPRTFMDPDNPIDQIMFNLNRMAAVQTTDNASILMHIQISDEQALRFELSNGTIMQDQTVTLSTDAQTNLINATQWAFTDSLSDHYGFILWGHAASLMLRDHETNKIVSPSRSFFFIDQNEFSCASQLSSLLTNITTTVINKKFDLLAFDSCLGTRIEHAYLFANVASYMVACQNCYLMDGFEYSGLIARLSAGAAPLEIINGLISDYDQFFSVKPEYGRYAVSAISCDQALVVKQGIDTLSPLLIQAIHDQPSLISQFNASHETLSPHFCHPDMYTDLITTCNQLTDIFQAEYYDYVLDLSLMSSIIAQLQQVKADATNAIVAHLNGRLITDANGLSIYWPTAALDSMYLASPFGQQSSWTDFLQAMIS